MFNINLKNSGSQNHNFRFTIVTFLHAVNMVLYNSTWITFSYAYTIIQIKVYKIVNRNLLHKIVLNNNLRI